MTRGDREAARQGAAPVSWEARADLLIAGGGVAGLSAARAAAAAGLRVLVVQKGGAAGEPDTSTAYAQGGVAVARAESDTPAAHADDTCAAGGGLCDRAAVQSVVADGERAVTGLVAAGARFDRADDGGYAATREGGHRARRILHAGGDATGTEVQRALDAACARGGPGPGIVRMRGAALLRVCTDCGGVCGALVEAADGIGVVHAPTVLLATGGAGRLFESSTNPAEATADGLALALDAGAVLADVEFIQFHPTALRVPAGRVPARSPLISEAVRGEGAVLVDARGASVTRGMHPMGDLAPRDVVARAIATRLRGTGDDHVFLDARGIERFALRFPTIAASCARIGVDPASDLVPVVPAAHFSCGGVATDLAGRTGVPGLVVAGEAARTGMHGANRLASNSLLEGLVVGARAGAGAAARAGAAAQVRDAEFRRAPIAPRRLVQRAMTEHASVLRDAGGIATAAATITQGARRTFAVDSSRAAEDAALTLAARAVLLAAAARTETRGCHTRTDHGRTDPGQQASIRIVLGRDGAPRIAPANGGAAAGAPAALRTVRPVQASETAGVSA